LLEKLSLCPDSLANFESLCKHMAGKFHDKDAKKTHFRKQIEFQKKAKDCLKINQAVC
jgi:hypothetical protein